MGPFNDPGSDSGTGASQIGGRRGRSESDLAES